MGRYCGPLPPKGVTVLEGEGEGERADKSAEAKQLLTTAQTLLGPTVRAAPGGTTSSVDTSDPFSGSEGAVSAFRSNRMSLMVAHRLSPAATPTLFW